HGLLGPSGATIGFLMPAVTDAKPLHTLFSPKARRQAFPKASFNFLVEVAGGIATAIDAFHNQDLVVGDINGKNILVTQTGCVRFIDIDSIQVGDGRRFPCSVGVPEYTPPELQGRSLSKYRRTRDSDLFGLPVIIFQLLAMGRHPFDGTRLDRTKAIKRHVNAFGRVLFRSRPLAPVGLMTDAVLDVHLAELFRGAFAVRSRFVGRPPAKDWTDALARFQGTLNGCSRNALHQYPFGQTKCPWCALERRGKPSLFAPAAATYTHWREHYDAMMRLLLGRYAGLVIPDSYEPILRLLPRRAWYGLGAVGMLILLRSCFLGAPVQHAPKVSVIPPKAVTSVVPPDSFEPSIAKARSPDDVPRSKRSETQNDRKKLAPSVHDSDAPELSTAPQKKPRKGPRTITTEKSRAEKE
ncbi:MAG: hypothetical protein ABL907_21350, partial [Hyphomicrobium sp.]